MASKAQRKRARWVKAAHAMGLTFEGYKFWKSGGSRSLAERKESSLRRQADREMERAYQPVEQTFSKREQQIKDLDAKHAADEAAYQNWLAAEQGKIMQEQDNRVAATRALVEGHQAALVTRVDEMAQERIKANQAIGGATAPEGAVTATTREAVVAGGSRGVQSVAEKTLRGADLTSATAANNLAYTASLRSKRQAVTLEALAEVATGREKAALQKASDHNRRIAALLEGEVQKAQLRIASEEFSTKESNDLLDAARGRGVSRDKTAATREGQAGTQRRWEDTTNKYGFTNKEWKQIPSSRRQRIVKRYEKEQKDKKTKKGGPNARQRSSARNYIATLRQQAAGVVRPKPGKDGEVKAWPPPKVGPNNALVLSTWLQRNWGWDKNLADIVAWETAYKHKPGRKYPKGIQKRFDQYAASLPS
jgi:hypothetical protein